MMALFLAGVALTCEVLPGFTQQGASRLYEGDNLFEYMDGNSEGYLVYGFLRMNGITCTKGTQKILIDISEMPDSESAYGLFSAFRDVSRDAEAIGTAGQVVPRKAIFVKDKYFVELAAEEQGDHSALLRAAAIALEARVPGSTAKPAPIGWFSTEGLTAGPPRLVPESVLGLRALKRGYMAQYGSAKVFVVTEDSPDAARGVMAKLRERFQGAQPAAVGEEGLQVTDAYLGRICIARRGTRIVGAAGAPESANPLALVSAQLARVPQ